jgi:hypothetical protein
MSFAISIIERLHHRLRFAFSPSYRQIRRRLDEIAAS